MVVLACCSQMVWQVSPWGTISPFHNFPIWSLSHSYNFLEVFCLLVCLFLKGLSPHSGLGKLSEVYVLLRIIWLQVTEIQVAQVKKRTCGLVEHTSRMTGKLKLSFRNLCFACLCSGVLCWHNHQEMQDSPQRIQVHILPGERPLKKRCPLAWRGSPVHPK